MELLRKTTAAALTLALLCSCGPVSSVTEVIPLDTDTYISSSDPSNHVELDHLDISKSGALEERIITKLPTTDQDSESVVEQTLDDFFVTLFFFPLAIISDLLQCDAQITQPQNLTSAYLVFDVNTNPQGALDGLIQLRTLSKPWWQTVNWVRAQPFSGRGVWATPGGDVDPSFLPVQAQSTGTDSIQFDITHYFQNLIEANGTAAHYGFLLESTGTSLLPVTLHSTQYEEIDARPRLVSTYVGTCGSDTSIRLRRRTTILGAKHKVIDEVL